jgi:hypothetical protein
VRELRFWFDRKRLAGLQCRVVVVGLPQTDRHCGAAFKTVIALLVGRLLLIEQRRPADSFLPEVEIHLDVVGDLDERNAFVHPIVFTVENHFSFNLP